MCSRENKSVSYTHTHTILYIIKFYMFLSLYITDYLIGLTFWALVCGLEWDQKGTNKTLAPMSLELFYQLLTSPKLSLIIFNTTI